MDFLNFIEQSINYGLFVIIELILCHLIIFYYIEGLIGHRPSPRRDFERRALLLRQALSGVDSLTPLKVRCRVVLI